MESLLALQYFFPIFTYSGEYYELNYYFITYLFHFLYCKWTLSSLTSPIFTTSSHLYSSVPAVEKAWCPRRSLPSSCTLLPPYYFTFISGMLEAYIFYCVTINKSFMPCLKVDSVGWKSIKVLLLLLLWIFFTEQQSITILFCWDFFPSGFSSELLLSSIFPFILSFLAT